MFIGVDAIITYLVGEIAYFKRQLQYSEEWPRRHFLGETDAHRHANKRPGQQDVVDEEEEEEEEGRDQEGRDQEGRDQEGRDRANKDEEEDQDQDETRPKDIPINPLLVACCYMFNPLSIATCLAKSTGLFNSLSIWFAIYLACQGTCPAGFNGAMR